MVRTIIVRHDVVTPPGTAPCVGDANDGAICLIQASLGMSAK